MIARRDRVLATLRQARADGIDGGWVCARVLQHWDCGGNRWNARLHELKDHGYAINGVCVHTTDGGCRECIPIEKKQCDCARCTAVADRQLANDEPPTRMTAWRLGDAAEQIALPLGADSYFPSFAASKGATP